MRWGHYQGNRDRRQSFGDAGYGADYKSLHTIWSFLLVRLVLCTPSLAFDLMMTCRDPAYQERSITLHETDHLCSDYTTLINWNDAMETDNDYYWVINQRLIYRVIVRKKRRERKNPKRFGELKPPTSTPTPAIRFFSFFLFLSFLTDFTISKQQPLMNRQCSEACIN